MNRVDILKLNPQQNFTSNIRTVEAELFRAGGRTDGRSGRRGEDGRGMCQDSVANKSKDWQSQDDRHIHTKCQCVIKKQEARHEFQRNVRISFTAQMFEHTEGAVYRESSLRQPVSTLQTTCFRSAKQLNRVMADNSTITVWIHSKNTTINSLKPTADRHYTEKFKFYEKKTLHLHYTDQPANAVYWN